MQRCVKDKNSEKLNSLEHKIYNMGQSRPNVKKSRYIQLNEYETDLYYITLRQHMAIDCLLIHGFLPVLTFPCVLSS